MSGPPPTPTALKILRGNPGKRRLNRDEPVSAPFDATPPPGLSPDAIAQWEIHVPELLRMGTVQAVDREEIKLFCIARAKGLADAEDAPHRAMKWLAMSSRIGARYGIGASDRSKVTATPKKPESKWAGLIGGKKA